MGGEGRVVVVSNRTPSVSTPSSEEERRNLPVGGLVSCLRPFLETQGGIWMGWDGTSDGQGDTAPTTITEVEGMRLASVSLSRDEVERFYNTFSNRTLWPILHGFPDKATISHDSYRVYRSVNRKYAASLIDLLRPGDLVSIQDFHLFPLGRELRKLGWTGRIGFFLHSPFPPSEIFGVLPWARKLLTCIFDYDLVGLQTQKYLHNLQESLGDELGAGLIGDTVHHHGRTLKVGSFPVGADVQAFREMALSQVPTPVSRFLEDFPKDRQLLIGVDRLDYTKGIVQRMQAIERLLDDHPELRGHVTLIQISAPSRVNIPEYAQERERYDSLVGKINGRFGEAHWMPIHPPAPPLFPAGPGPLLSRGRHLPRHLSPGRHEFSRQGVRSLPDLRPRGLGHFPLLRRRRVHAGRSHGQPLRLSADSFRHLPRLDHAQTRATTSLEGPLQGRKQSHRPRLVLQLP